MRHLLDAKQYWDSPEHVRNYLAKAHLLPHCREGDEVLVRQIPANACKVLDLGTGDGHLVDLVLRRRPKAHCVGVDASVHMLRVARHRFRWQKRVEILHHDLNDPIFALGPFDAIVSRFATHNLDRRRQLKLYAEVFSLLNPGGVFCNLEHVPAPTEQLHERFYEELGDAADCFDDITSKPVTLTTHLRWLRELEFGDVDCHWQWLEMALIIATKRPVAGRVLDTPRAKVDRRAAVVSRS